MPSRVKDPDLDCGFNLGAGCDRTKTPGRAAQPLSNATDSERHSFREKPKNPIYALFMLPRQVPNVSKQWYRVGFSGGIEHPHFWQSVFSDALAL
jgi:hypothetical protein